MISLILGLGNAGQHYSGTRHNVGFEVVTACGRLLSIDSSETRDGFVLETVHRPEGSILLARPTTLMNRSGFAANALVSEFGLSPSEMLVLVDDFNLPLGRLRVREKGSDGGHNGLASIIEWLGTDAFPRIRLGIGPLPPEVDAAEFVLESFTLSERPEVDRMVERAAEAVLYAKEHPLERVMSQYNVNPASPDDSQDSGGAV